MRIRPSKRIPGGSEPTNFPTSWAMDASSPVLRHARRNGWIETRPCRAQKAQTVVNGAKHDKAMIKQTELSNHCLKCTGKPKKR